MNEQRKAEIAQAAKKLQWHILREAEAKGLTISSAEIRDPRTAVEFLGYNLYMAETLGSFDNGMDRFEVAGYIDRKRNRIGISKKFKSEAINFTIGHEVGHAVLHQNLKIAHHDRPLSGWDHISTSKPEHDVEADYFASCYAMPKQHVEKAFKQRFGKAIPDIFFDYNLAWNLCPDDPESLLRPRTEKKVRAITLATFESSFNIKPMMSLARLFQVSPTAMAIRLQELGLKDL